MIGPGRNNAGERSDLVGVPYTPDSETILAYLQTSYYHVHGEPFVYPRYDAPILLTSAAPSWDLTGSKTEIIPAGAIDKDFDLHWASISEISAVLFGIIDFFIGEIGQEILIGGVDANRTSNFAREIPVPTQVPQIPANSRVSARFSDNTTSPRTVRLKFYGHKYA